MKWLMKYFKKSRHTYWVYEIDSFMGTEVSLIKSFSSKSKADKCQELLNDRTKFLGPHVRYSVLELKKGNPYHGAKSMLKEIYGVNHVRKISYDWLRD